MKKNISLISTLACMALCIVVMIALAVAFSGCSKNQSKKSENGNSLNGGLNGRAEKKLKIISTVFPSYDWTKNIAGDNAEVELLISDGTDFHSFEPTVRDIVKITNCDVFIYVGGESDSWVSDVLKNSTNKNLKTINLIESLGDKAKIEELIEGMQEESEHAHFHDVDDHDHNHDHDEETADHDHDADVDDHDHDDEAEGLDHNHDHDHDDEAEAEYDEHVWLSVKNAKILCDKIALTLASIDEKNKTQYFENLSTYEKKLNDLDEQYFSKISSASKKTILVADRFPFRYLVDDYDLNYFAAFVGCSAETEASFKTISFLSKKVDELNLHSIFKIENSDDKLCNTIIENSSLKNQKILKLDSMQSIKKEQIDGGVTYEKIMKSNLEQLILGLE